MRTSLRTLMAVFLTAAAIFGSTVASTATETDKVVKTKATYDRAELVRNLGRSMIITSKSEEKITFNVNIDEEGDVTRLTYSHNVTSQNAETVNNYIRKAYNAIMATEFTPATKDGEPVKDTLQIEFDITG